MTNTKQTQDDKTIQPFNCSTIQRVKAYAFTLAETLIVIGIIGVVAALTLPNLNHATGDKEKVTKVKKIYASLTDAFDRAQAVYGDYDTWFTDLYNSYGYVDYSNWATKSERMAKRITEFMKVSKDCGFDEGCISTAPLKTFQRNGDIEDIEDNYLESLQDGENVYTVLLSDGIALAFLGGRDRIKVDIDGPSKGKNLYGDDIHDFCITNKNNVTLLVPSYYDTDISNLYLMGSNNGGNHTAWVIENGNLDYLKCPDELDWETQTSCK